ncbi:type B 50S ribosomal protein L31 [Vibrio metschnikovii]
MKVGIHPEYRPVVFHDTSVDKYFMIGSTLKTDPRRSSGKMAKLTLISRSKFPAESHPYYTGKQRVIQKEGRVANFNRRFAQFTKE